MTDVVADLTAEFRLLPLSRPWGPDRTDLRLIVTEVRTASGATGTGFSWTPTIGGTAVLAMLTDDIRPALLGRSADPAPVWDALWAYLREAGGGGITTIALSGVDIALWDLRARAAGLSLVDLIGRRRDSVEAYGSGINRHYPVEALVEQAERWVAAGFGAVKVKIGRPDLAEDVARVAAVRAVIGPRRRLMLDANQRWDLPAALRAVRALDRFEPYWLEEPLPADDLAAYARLAAATTVPIAQGESLYTAGQFQAAAAGVTVLQPNVVRVGGITPFLRIAELGRLAGVPVAPHLLPDLSGQLALCLPGVTMVEDVEDASFAALGALTRPSGVEVKAGRLTADTGPGHGLAFGTGHTDRGTEWAD